MRMLKALILVLMVLAGSAGLTSLAMETQTTDQSALLILVGAVATSKWMAFTMGRHHV